MGTVTRDMIPQRKSAQELVRNTPNSLGSIDGRLMIAIESELNWEWWRGYFAGRQDAQEDASFSSRAADE